MKPNTSPFRNIVTSAEERRQQAQAIEEVSLDEECWDEVCVIYSYTAHNTVEERNNNKKS